MAADETCSCGEPATKLCDWLIGFEKTARHVHYLDREVFTCNQPLCDNCGERVGVRFFSGAEGFADTNDYCPYHSRQKRQGLHNLRRPLLTAERAAAVRANAQRFNQSAPTA